MTLKHTFAGPVLAACFFAAGVACAEDIVIDTSQSIDTFRVFGSEHPGIYKHPASITELANGDLYIAYYGGAGEYSAETAV